MYYIYDKYAKIKAENVQVQVAKNWIFSKTLHPKLG